MVAKKEKRGRVNWNARFMAMAELVSTWSKDPSTQVGCVIVTKDRRILSTGYNGMPRGCDDGVVERLERPLKYMWFEHAERNAIYNAARHGVSVAGTVAYCTMFPCADCARAIVQSGVATVVAPSPNLNCPRWGESNREAWKILLECGVTFTVFTEGAKR